MKDEVTVEEVTVRAIDFIGDDYPSVLRAAAQWLEEQQADVYHIEAYLSQFDAYTVTLYLCND